MDRTTMVAEVRRRLGEDSPDFWADSDIIRNLDQAVVKFTREEKWPWLYTVGAGTLNTGVSTFTLPADVDFSRAFNLRLTFASEQPIMPRRVGAVEGYNLATRHFNDTGAPKWFYVASGAQDGVTMEYTLRFVPAADKNYTLDYLYLRRPAALSAGTAEPDMPEDYHEAVVAYATAKLWQHEIVGGDIKAREQFNIYNDILTNARRELYVLQDDEEIVWGKAQDEAELAGYGGLLPNMPQDYGWPTHGWQF